LFLRNEIKGGSEFSEIVSSFEGKLTFISKRVILKKNMTNSKKARRKLEENKD